MKMNSSRTFCFPGAIFTVHAGIDRVSYYDYKDIMGKSNELSYDFYFSRAQPAQVESLIKKFNDFVGYPSKVQSYPEAKKGTGRFWDQTIHVAPMSGEGAYDPKAPEYDYLDVADIMQMLAEDEKLTYEMKLLD